MQKVLNIFLSLVFLMSSMGVKVNKHHSDGRFFCVSTYQESESSCATNCNCDMLQDEQTCHPQDDNTCSCDGQPDFFKLANVYLAENSDIKLSNKDYSSTISSFIYNYLKNSSISKRRRIIKPTHLFLTIDVQSELGVYLI